MSQLLAGFQQPIDDAQQAFRLILKALSEPGKVVSLPAEAAWAPLNSASTATLLTLLDGETPLYLAESFQQPDLLATLRFHTGTPVCAEPEQASFALFDGLINATELARLPVGSEMSPEFSATVLLQVSSLTGGKTLRLSGPGIETQIEVAPQLPEVVLNYLQQRPQRFPQGLDFIFTCGERLLALPRTTHVEVC